MVPRSEWEQMKRDIEALKRSQGQVAPTAPGTPTTPGTVPATTPSEETPPPVDSTTAEPSNTQPAAGGNKGLLLPDISFIGQARGLLSTDKRDPNRGSFRLSEGELGIQSYVYPNVKADAFITGSPAEDSPFQVEEGYLTFIGFKKGLNINVGRKFAPFGRTGELHNHSWLYPRQLIPIRNLVSEEALVGDGVNLHYLLPLQGKIFVRASLGAFTGEGPGTISSNPFGVDLPAGPAAGFNSRFINGRIWSGYALNPDTELELGVSRAQGHSAFVNDGGAVLGAGHVALNGADISYRHFMGGGRRLLLRSEYFQNSPSNNLITHRATGYYALGNLRYNPLNDIGVLYENSGYPQAAGRENALSLIYTKQFTEQFYVRLMGTRGSRPGKSGYNEAWLQFVWGVGPHTHNLE